MKKMMVAVMALAFLFSGSPAQAEQTQAKNKRMEKARQALMDALGKVPKNCRFKGKRLSGKVKIVKSFPDFKVKVVSSFPDIKVKKVSSPSKCGEWKFVTSFPDFKIKFVTSFPDFTIKYVSSFPGVK